MMTRYPNRVCPNCGFPLPIIELTYSERRVVDCVLKGLSDKEIVAEIEGNRNTVRHQLDSAFKKLGVDNRTQLVIAIVKREGVECLQ